MPITKMNPLPFSPEEKAHAEHARAALTAYIQQHGPIPFQAYMEWALYHPQYGYYRAPHPKFGSKGDFVTSSGISSLFAHTLAHPFKSVLEHLKTQKKAPMSILEFGPGNGEFAAQMLLSLEALEALPEQYLLLELSASLKMCQKETIEKHAPHLLEKVLWLDRLPNHFNGLIFANEVVDAFSVHQFQRHPKGLLEGFVGLDANEAFTQQWRLCQNPQMLEYLTYIERTIGEPLAQGYCSEMNLSIKPWLMAIEACLDTGFCFFFDYGFSTQEYYHRDRAQGTLMCHAKHRTHPDVFAHIGQQDITAHVDFGHFAKTAHDLGFHIQGYERQGTFLLACGLLDCIPSSATPAEQLKFSQQIQRLCQPHEMGELFKVLALSKNTSLTLEAFSTSHMTHRLFP